VSRTPPPPLKRRAGRPVATSSRRRSGGRRSPAVGDWSRAEPARDEVAVAAPAVRPYAPYKDFTGRVATKDPVKVVPRVSGIVLRRLFTDGKDVTGPVVVFGIEFRPGQRLFEIDPVQYDADVKKADADQKKVTADIKNWTAQIALAAGSRRLVLTHLSSRYDEAGAARLPAQARQVFPRTDLAEAADECGARTPPQTAWEHYALGRSLLQSDDLQKAAADDPNLPKKKAAKALAAIEQQLGQHLARGGQQVRPVARGVGTLGARRPPGHLWLIHGIHCTAGNITGV